MRLSKSSSGLLTLVLSGCSFVPLQNETYGVFFEHGKKTFEYGQRIKILYETDASLGESLDWPLPKDSLLLEAVTEKLMREGTYVSIFPAFKGQEDLSLRLAQYQSEWDALVLTDWDSIDGVLPENLGKVYIAYKQGDDLKIGKVNILDFNYLAKKLVPRMKLKDSLSKVGFD